MTQISNNIYCSDFLLDIDVKTKLLPNPYYDYPYLIIKDFLSSNECDDINKKVKEDDDYEQAQVKIKDLLIITLGENGSLLYDGKEKLHIKAKKVKVVETTGAGDSFIGAFAYKLLNDLPYKEAAEFASLVSAVTVTKVGAQDSMPTYEEVNGLF